jgi:NhaP-type Na+/H+ or K+/H+ antiporter
MCRAVLHEWVLKKTLGISLHAAAAAAAAAAAGGRHITSRIKVEMHAFWNALEWLANTLLFVWVSGQESQTPTVM